MHLFISPKISGSPEGGFTLLEILVVSAITVLLSTSLILSLSRSRSNINQSVNILISDIRSAQAKALSVSEVQGKRVCGWGIHVKSATTYFLYAGKTPDNCKTQIRNYDPAIDYASPDSSFVDPNVTILNPDKVSDIFFEPPVPWVYINNASVSVSENITLCDKANNCKTITVDSNGKIQ